MKILFFVLSLFFLFNGNVHSIGNKISAIEFGAIPDDGKNDIEAFKKIADYCKKHPGTELFLSPGKYDFFDDLAQKIEIEAISGEYGEDVQGRLFTPKLKYAKAVDFSKCRDLQIKGYGVNLIMHGWYQVITFESAKNIKLEGVNILYHRSPSTVGKVISSSEKSFDMIIDPSYYTFIDNIVTGRVHFFDNVRRRFYTGGVSKKELINKSLIRISSRVHPNIGDYCILRHCGHYRPTIMIKESKDILIKDVRIFSQPGMGVVGHLSNNITLDNLQVVPLPGNIISTNTDATHFTSCSGDLTIKNCKFKGQGDDCTNIHNYYYNFYPFSKNGAEIKIENADLHALSLDYPSVGDTMSIINRKNMKEVGKYVVCKVDTSYNKWKVDVYFKNDLPSVKTSDYIITNITRFPNVVICNNTVNSHLGRSFLVKARNVHIYNNYIDGSTHTAIKLGAELSWNESGPVEKALIENNYITNSGYDISPDDASCVMLSTEASERPPFVNKNIIIRNNVFDTDKKYAILLKDAEQIIVTNNIVNNIGYIRSVNCTDIITSDKNKK